MRALVVGALVVVSGWRAYGLELVSTRTTGQFRVEATPVAVDVNDDGVDEWLLVGERGQVLVWNRDLSDFGSGQDGEVARLPKGPWPSAPAELGGGDSRRYVFVSVEGLVVALDGAFAPAWEYRLPGKTTWSRATPLVLGGGEALVVVGDQSGTLTALRPDGTAAWTKAFGLGPCRTQVQPAPGDPNRFLAPLGPYLACVDRAGDVVWTTELGAAITARPEVVDLPEGRRILCGTENGTLAALSVEGAVQWTAEMGDELDCSITVLPRKGDAPLVVATGLWGNLHAFDTQGRRVWTHVFRAKNRTRPLLVDIDGDGQDEVLVATYGQRGYVVNADGRRVDEMRLSGTVNAWPVLVRDAGESPDVLVITGVLLAHRFRMGLPEPTYGSVGPFAEVGAELAPADHPDGPAVVVSNPNHAFVRANVVMTAADGTTTVAGAHSARETIVIPLPSRETADRIEVELSDPAGTAHSTVTLDRVAERAIEESLPVARAWATPAYASFDPTCLGPHAMERDLGVDGVVVALYQDEGDQGACVVASRADAPMRARVEMEALKREDGTAFAGAIMLREVVHVPTVNGEMVGDALPALGDSRLITLAPGRAAKIWISVDATGAAAGIYAGLVRITPLSAPELAVALPLTIVVSDLAMPKDFPLTFCTWDYLPNTWFPEDTASNLDEMGRHGVDVFPRSTLPTASYADGSLAIDWSPLDAELDRLAGRGEILFHLGEPGIAGADALDAGARRGLQIEYLHALRDHVHARGLSYGDYAFYPVDEPGLDYGVRVPGYIAAAELIREADSQFRMYTDPVPGLSWQDYGRIAPLVDVWCPNMRLVNGLLLKDPRMEDILASGKPAWSYECVSQVKSLSPLRYNRANAWRADYFGLDGIGHWTYSTTQANHWFANADKNDEYAMVYPGDRPVPSLRWEAVRDGIEDVAALAMLREAVERHRTAGTKPEAVAEAERFLKGAQIDVMELSDQVFVESRDFLAQGDRRLWHTWWDVVRYDEIRRRVEELTLRLAAGG